MTMKHIGACERAAKRIELKAKDAAEKMRKHMNMGDSIIAATCACMEQAFKEALSIIREEASREK